MLRFRSSILVLGIGLLFTSCQTMAPNLEPVLHEALIPRSDPAPPADVIAASTRHIEFLQRTWRINSDRARSERRKHDILRGSSLFIAAFAALLGANADENPRKADFALVLSGITAFSASLLSQFKHEEDAMRAHQCAVEIEAVLGRFVVPESRPKLDSLRAGHTDLLQKRGCLSVGSS